MCVSIVWWLRWRIWRRTEFKRSVNPKALTITFCIKKVKFCFELGSRNQQPPIQRNAANARERARMRVLSSAFCRLKTKLPWVPADTKLSKLDTLRLATIYIQQLRASLSKEETDDEIFCQANAQSLVSTKLFFLFFV